MFSIVLSPNSRVFVVRLDSLWLHSFRHPLATKKILDSLRLGDHNALSFGCVFYVRLDADTQVRRSEGGPVATAPEKTTPTLFEQGVLLVVTVALLAVLAALHLGLDYGPVDEWLSNFADAHPTIAGVVMLVTALLMSLSGLRDYRKNRGWLWLAWDLTAAAVAMISAVALFVVATRGF